MTPASWWRITRARPRLAWSVAAGLAAYALLPWVEPMRGDARVLVAWNLGALLYLALAWHMVRVVDAKGIAQRAVGQDEGRFAVLLLVALAAAAVLLAVGSQLSSVRNLHGAARSLHIGLAALTVFTSWSFTHLLFALHYAHDFYLARSRHGTDPLQFPGTKDPDYGDFLYFACVIGTSGQTADVAFSSSALRRVGTAHCVLAFFFNATLLALSINLAAGLLL